MLLCMQHVQIHNEWIQFTEIQIIETSSILSKHLKININKTCLKHLNTNNRLNVKGHIRTRNNYITNICNIVCSSSTTYRKTINKTVDYIKQSAWKRLLLYYANIMKWLHKANYHVFETKNEVIVKLDKIRMLCCVKMKPCKRQLFDNVNICVNTDNTIYRPYEFQIWLVETIYI